MTLTDVRAAALRRRTRASSAAVTAFASDVRHVLAIATDGLATFAAGHSRFVRGELVRGAFCVRCAPAFARNFTLLGRIHRRKTALAGICHRCLLNGVPISYCVNC
jgi:hypothetical protein